MTGGQSALALDVSAAMRTEQCDASAPARVAGMQLAMPEPTGDALRQHEAMLELIQKASGGKAIWRPVTPPDGDGTHKNH